MPSIYFAHEREVFERDGMLYAVQRVSAGRATARRSCTAQVRYRTVGDASLHRRGRVRRRHRRRRSSTRSPSTRITERGATRGDDRFSEAAMEDRKKEGYF